MSEHKTKETHALGIYFAAGLQMNMDPTLWTLCLVHCPFFARIEKEGRGFEEGQGDKDGEECRFLVPFTLLSTAHMTDNKAFFKMKGTQVKKSKGKE